MIQVILSSWSPGSFHTHFRSIQIIFIYSYSNIKDWTFLQITSNHYCNIQPCPIDLDIQDEIQDDTQDGIKEIVEHCGMSMVILWFYLAMEFMGL